jgi:hypothetical protein
MKLLPLILLLASATSEAKTVVSGIYFRIEDAEYESAFIPCGSKEIWWIEGGTAYGDLLKKYQVSSKEPDAELVVTLLLTVTQVDKRRFPNSHYAASATVDRIVQIGSSKACKANP